MTAAESKAIARAGPRVAAARAEATAEAVVMAAAMAVVGVGRDGAMEDWRLAVLAEKAEVVMVMVDLPQRS